MPRTSHNTDIPAYIRHKTLLLLLFLLLEGFDGWFKL